MPLSRPCLQALWSALLRLPLSRIELVGRTLSSSPVLSGSSAVSYNVLQLSVLSLIDVWSNANAHILALSRIVVCWWWVVSSVGFPSVSRPVWSPFINPRSLHPRSVVGSCRCNNGRSPGGSCCNTLSNLVARISTALRPSAFRGASKSYLR